MQKLTCKLSWLLTAIGAINWGLVGLFGVNLVHSVLGNCPIMERGTYTIIGVAGLLSLYSFFGTTCAEDGECAAEGMHAEKESKVVKGRKIGKR